MNWTGKDVAIVCIFVFTGGMFSGVGLEHNKKDSSIVDGAIIENGDKVYRVVEVKKVVTYQDIASSTVIGSAVYSGEK